MLRSAKWIYDDIKEQGFLDDKLLKNDTSKFRDYKLRITGHSLGAGCAAILSLLLRPAYNDLKCLAFSPPGCTLSEGAAVDSEDYVTTYLLDCDIIPRSSLRSLENLRYDLVDMIARIQVPKHDVLTSYPCVYGNLDVRTSNSQILSQETEPPDSVFLQQWHKFQELYMERKQIHVIWVSKMSYSLLARWCKS